MGGAASTKGRSLFPRPVANPKPDPCPTRIRLIAELQRIHSEIMLLDNRQVRILLRGGSIAELKPTEEKLAVLRPAREEAMEEIRQHVIEHGC
jgi:hypothetical protein